MAKARKPLKRKTPLKRTPLKRTATKKKRKPVGSVAALKKKAWELCSRAIRLEARESDGLVTCITCGVRLPWNRGIQAGHFIDGRYNAILFDERGIHPQCMGCNVMLNGRKEEYFVFMEGKYGREVIDELRRQRNQSRSFTAEELEVMIVNFKQRIDRWLGRFGP
jgi:hypothetical protein